MDISNFNTRVRVNDVDVDLTLTAPSNPVYTIQPVVNPVVQPV